MFNLVQLFGRESERMNESQAEQLLQLLADIAMSLESIKACMQDVPEGYEKDMLRILDNINVSISGVGM